MSYEDHLPYVEPDEIVTGETVEWKRRLTDFVPADGWTLRYHFRGAGAALDVDAAADGSNHKVTITSVQSATLAEGACLYQAWAMSGSVKHLVGEGEIRIRIGFATVTDPYDGRSQVKKILDAIDAMVLGKATLDQQEYTIGTGDSTRMLKRIPITELLALRTRYAQMYSRERRAQRRRDGEPYFKNILVRFTEPR
jgi:hypothetical protein